jgi:hypothetical protein
MAPARPERLRRDAPAAGRPDALAPAQVVGELAAHQHEPGILRDTACAACRAEAVLGADQDDAGRRD